MSTSAFFIYPAVIRLLYEGSLIAYIDAYAAQLLEQGFSRDIARHKIKLFVDFSHWLKKVRFDIDNLDDLTIERYKKYRPRSSFRPPRLNFGRSG